MNQFAPFKFEFKTGGWVYFFQCYEGMPNLIDIIREDSEGYTAQIHHILNGKIMWTNLSDYVSEDAKKFGDRIVKLLVFV